jgi:hypothetical protein
MTLEQIKSFFSTANNDYVVARTTKPGFDTASKAILDGIESLALNRGYLLENFVSKLTFDSDNARNIIYLGNSKERFLTMLVTNENLISLETFENAYALLASQVLVQNVAAHSFAENMFKQSLTAEAASYNSKKLLAEEWTRDLNDYRELRSKIVSDLETLATMSDGDNDKIKELDNLLTKVDVSIAKTQDALDSLVD